MFTVRPPSSSSSRSARRPAPRSITEARPPLTTTRWRSRRGRLERAKQDGKDVLIVDTSGRLHVDEELMAELVRIREAVKPHNVLLVVDAMTGQDAVNVAEQLRRGGATSTAW